MKINIGVNGLGRIGKNVLRRFFETTYQNLNLVAINIGKSNIESKLHLLKYDSIHGIFKGIDYIQDDKISINGSIVHLIKENSIKDIEWSRYNVTLVLECTGMFNDRLLSLEHIKQGVKQVVISSICKNADKTIIMGVNQKALSLNDEIVSIGSCTTNCLAPIATILDKNLNIRSGFVTTIHSYTNDQRIIDASHQDVRRARAAAISMIPTTTNVAKAIGTVLPNLQGKIDGAAIRVPTPNVSMIDFTFISDKNTSPTEINKIIYEASENNYREIITIVTEKMVSIDFNHMSESAIVDANETKVVNKNFCRVVAWYDNEWAFSCRMLEVADLIARL